MKYVITPKSSNAKTGPILVTTSPKNTCPDACPFKAGGCYAKGGPLAAIWNGLDKTDANQSFKNGTGRVNVRGQKDLLDAIAAQKPGAMWRHNQAGDLPGQNNRINVKALADIVWANRKARAKGFTYTHKPMTFINAAIVRISNKAGFTINLSANNLVHADTLADKQAGPVTVVLDADQKVNVKTPAGRKVVVCPATIRDNVSCASCGLCARANRDFIVGFPAHGSAKRKASTIANLKDAA